MIVKRQWYHAFLSVLLNLMAVLSQTSMKIKQNIIKIAPKIPVNNTNVVSKAGQSIYLNYKGGPMLSHVEVTLIFYGNVQYAADLVSWYKGIVNSTYLDWRKLFVGVSFALISFK
jgi:hypothetical protein